MKYLIIATFLMIAFLIACETSLLEHDHPVPEHSHPVLEDPNDPDLDDLLKLIDNAIEATNLMYEIIDSALENSREAHDRYFRKTVTIRATVKEVEEVLIHLQGGGFAPPVIWVRLENIRNFPFYMDVSSVQDWKNSFKVGQTYTFTVFIENIGRPRRHGHRDPVVECVFLDW